MIYLAEFVVLSPIGALTFAAFKGDKGSRILLGAIVWLTSLLYVVARLCA